MYEFEGNCALNCIYAVVVMVTCMCCPSSQIEVKKATPREMTVRPSRGGGPPYGFRGWYIIYL